jgi:hypothetical protein
VISAEEAAPDVIASWSSVTVAPSTSTWASARAGDTTAAATHSVGAMSTPTNVTDLTAGSSRLRGVSPWTTRYDAEAETTKPTPRRREVGLEAERKVAPFDRYSPSQ